MEIDNALEFIKQLANGNNPITGEIVSNDTVLNNLEITRGLFNAYNTICEALNDKGIKRNEFKLTEEQIKLFPFSNNPIKITDIADRLNFLKEERLRKIQAVKITNWLLSKQLLENNSDTYGKNTRLPSEKGKELGITTITRIRDNGESYPINYYNKKAQKFILDNLNDLIENKTD